MRLLNTSSYELHWFSEAERPPYAILSHTWGRLEDEVTLQDHQRYLDGQANGVVSKPGFQKILGVCAEAQRNGLHWVWIDTCSIDKTSSAELSESINSMYRWYARAKVCYVYLADVPTEDVETIHSRFRASRWFTRGWTLQELIAPDQVVFYSQDWTVLGDRDALSGIIRTITGVPPDASYARYSVAKRMSWAAARNTTRPEDAAYCLLGLFNINMPLLYGEGMKAFRRLQEAIVASSYDQSIFAWGFETLQQQSTDQEVQLCGSFLAPSPSSFAGCHQVSLSGAWEGRKAIGFEIQKAGIFIELPIAPRQGQDEEPFAVALLNCRFDNDYGNLLALRFKRLNTNKDGPLLLQRVRAPPVLVSAKRAKYVELRMCHLLLSLDALPWRREELDVLDEILLRPAGDIDCSEVRVSAALEVEHGPNHIRLKPHGTTPVEEAIFLCRTNETRPFFLRIEVRQKPEWQMRLLGLLAFPTQRRSIRSWLGQFDQLDAGTQSGLSLIKWKEELDTGNIPMTTSTFDALFPLSDSDGAIVTVGPAIASNLVESTFRIFGTFVPINQQSLKTPLLVAVHAIAPITQFAQAKYISAVISLLVANALLTNSIIQHRTLHTHYSWAAMNSFRGVLEFVQTVSLYTIGFVLLGQICGIYSAIKSGEKMDFGIPWPVGLLSGIVTILASVHVDPPGLAE